MSKNGIIVNEWENLTALSNRRLNVDDKVHPLKLSWSIDRITIVGKLKENIYYHTPNDVLILNFEQLMQLNEGNGFVKSVGKNG
ncbi:TPA: replication protein, partial [Enterococcus faecium]|nr:replication protein [Enterococcus faecium]